MSSRPTKVATAKAEAAERMTYAMRDLLLAYKAALEESLRPYGLSLPQLRLLHAVDRKAEVSSAAIARECHVTPQTLQAMMTRAVREGWIRREKAEHNQRILTASLTPRGRRLLDRGEQFARAIEAEMWKDTGVKRLTSVTEILQRGTGAISRLEHPIKPR
ncbi:MAG TPA: MarR family transcriptional regulator [Acidobacteriaceae bacterium]|jgi:DNA-binding MarR family transcriptional regulator